MPYLLGSYAFTIIQLLAIIVVMSQVARQVFVVFIPVTVLCVWCQVTSIFLVRICKHFVHNYIHKFFYLIPYF